MWRFFKSGTGSCFKKRSPNAEAKRAHLAGASALDREQGTLDPAANWSYRRDLPRPPADGSAQGSCPRGEHGRLAPQGANGKHDCVAGLRQDAIGGGRWYRWADNNGMIILRAYIEQKSVRDIASGDIVPRTKLRFTRLPGVAEVIEAGRRDPS